MVTVIRNVNRKGYTSEVVTETGVYSRSPTWDDSQRSRQEDAVRDMLTSKDVIIIPESIYQANRTQIDQARQGRSNIRIVPDSEASAISQRGVIAQENIEAQKAAIQEKRRQSFEPASLEGRENIERSMLSEKAGTDWNPSFAGLVESNPGVRKKLEQAGVLSYEVNGKTFSKKEMAEGFAAQLNRESQIKTESSGFEELTGQPYRKTPFSPKGQDLFEKAILGTAGYKEDPKYGRMVRTKTRTPGEQAGDDLRGISDLLQGGLESGVEAVPFLPKPAKEGVKGAGSVVTGIPGFAGDIIQGSEYHVNEFREGKRSLIGGAFSQAGEYGMKQLTGLKELGQENPAKAIGAGAAMLFGGKAVKGVKKVPGAVKSGTESMKDLIGTKKTQSNKDLGIFKEYEIKPTTKQLMNRDVLETPFTAKNYIKTIQSPRNTMIAGVGITAMTGKARANPTENQLKAYNTILDYSTGKKEVIKVTQPHSPSKIDLNLDKKGAINFSKGLAKELESAGMDNIGLDAKGRIVKRPKGFSPQAMDEILSEPKYFNQMKEEAKVKHLKNINIGDEIPGIFTFKEPPKRGRSMAGVSEYNKLVGESSKKTIGKGKNFITMEGTPTKTIMDSDFKPASLEVHNKLVGEPQKKVIIRNKKATIVYKGKQDFDFDFPKLTKESHNKAVGEKQKTFLTADKYVNLQDMLLISPGQRVRLPSVRVRRGAHTKLSHNELLRRDRLTRLGLPEPSHLISDNTQESERQLIGRIGKPLQIRTPKEAISEKNIFGVREIVTQQPMIGDILGDAQQHKQIQKVVQEQKTRQRTKSNPFEGGIRTRNLPKFKLPIASDNKKSRASKKSPIDRAFGRFEKTNPIMEPWGSSKGINSLFGTSKRKKSRKGKRR